MTAPVSVLIPTYNRAHLIAETLDAILAQTISPAEIIVVDDGSRDNTGDVVARYKDKVRYVLQENGGVCRARNAAARLASSPYIAFCDSDDLWLPTKLEKQWELHACNPALTYSFTNFTRFSEGTWASQSKFASAEPGLLFIDPLPATGSLVLDRSIYDDLLRFQPIWPSTIMLSKEYFNTLNGFDELFSRNPVEDFEFTLRCARCSLIGVLFEPLVGVRRHDSNLSGQALGNVMGELSILRHALAQHGVNEVSAAVIREQIELRSVEAAYFAFSKGEFATVVSMVGKLPSSRLDRKMRAKLAISRLPQPLARQARKLLTRTEA